MQKNWKLDKSEFHIGCIGQQVSNLVNHIMVYIFTLKSLCVFDTVCARNSIPNLCSCQLPDNFLFATPRQTSLSSSSGAASTAPIDACSNTYRQMTSSAALLPLHWCPATPQRSRGLYNASRQRVFPPMSIWVPASLAPTSTKRLAQWSSPRLPALSATSNRRNCGTRSGAAKRAIRSAFGWRRQCVCVQPWALIKRMGKHID